MKIKLFCLPYAGGTAMFYKKWESFLNKKIELHPLEMPGRGKRFGYPLCNTVEGVVDDLFNLISKELHNSQYAFFGYSMGTLIIYELMRKLINAGYKEPLHIFFAGRFPPHMKEKEDIHMLPNEKFKEEIIKLGGIPKELVDNRELFEIILPILRADYEIVEKYQYVSTKPWNFDISALSGKEDKEAQEYDYLEWKRYTNKNCNFYDFEGDHFFVNKNMEQIINIVNTVLVD